MARTKKETKETKEVNKEPEKVLLTEAFATMSEEQSKLPLIDETRKQREKSGLPVCAPCMYECSPYEAERCNKGRSCKKYLDWSVKYKSNRYDPTKRVFTSGR